MFFVIFFAIATTGILILGILSMALGNKFNKKYAGKLMSLRVFLQALALLVLMASYFNSSN